MALIKKENNANNVRIFKEFLEAKEVFEDSNAEKDLRIYALEYIVEHKEIYYVLRILSELFKDNNISDNVYIDVAFSNFKNKPKREEDFDEMFKMLKSNNAYLRNAAIGFLQTYGEEAKGFIKKLLDDKDKDIRIFAINILGDVRFEDSLELIRYLLAKEDDINVIMTAVDYLGEIGNEDDIALLESIKERFKDDFYVEFGVNIAINRIKGNDVE